MNAWAGASILLIAVLFWSFIIWMNYKHEQLRLRKPAKPEKKTDQTWFSEEKTSTKITLPFPDVGEEVVQDLGSGVQIRIAWTDPDTLNVSLTEKNTGGDAQWQPQSNQNPDPDSDSS